MRFRMSFAPRVNGHVQICGRDDTDASDEESGALLVLEVDQDDKKAWTRARVQPVDEPGEPFWISSAELRLAGKTLRFATPKKRVQTHGLDGRVPLTFRRAPSEENVNVLLVSEEFLATGDATRFVARFLIDELRRCHKTLPEGEEWFVWTGTRDHHPEALIFWVGISAAAPRSVLDSLADVIELTGCETARGKAVPARHGLSPLLYLGEGGLELLSMF